MLAAAVRRAGAMHGIWTNATGVAASHSILVIDRTLGLSGLRGFHCFLPSTNRRQNRATSIAHAPERRPTSQLSGLFVVAGCVDFDVYRDQFDGAVVGELADDRECKDEYSGADEDLVIVSTGKQGW